MTNEEKLASDLTLDGYDLIMEMSRGIVVR